MVPIVYSLRQQHPTHQRVLKRTVSGVTFAPVDAPTPMHIQAALGGFSEGREEEYEGGKKSYCRVGEEGMGIDRNMKQHMKFSNDKKIK